MNDDIICKKAVELDKSLKKVWNYRFLMYVAEAKSRKLTCGVNKS